MRMTKAELFEEIRSLLREPQIETVSDPWLYSDEDLEVQVRSALRHLRVLGLSVQAVWDENLKDFTTLPTEREGILIALIVAERLLTGDLIQKLYDGELGTYINAGGDVIDTKTATRAFQAAADRFRERIDLMVAVVNARDGNGEHVAALFGGPTPYMA